MVSRTTTTELSQASVVQYAQWPSTVSDGYPGMLTPLSGWPHSHYPTTEFQHTTTRVVFTKPLLIRARTLWSLLEKMPFMPQWQVSIHVEGWSSGKLLRHKWVNSSRPWFWPSQVWVLSYQPFPLWHWATCSQSLPTGLHQQPIVHFWRHPIYVTHHKLLCREQVWRLFSPLYTLLPILPETGYTEFTHHCMC